MTHSQPNPRSGQAITGRWELAPQHSSVGFRVRLPWGIATVTGHFDEFSGWFDLSATPAVVLAIEAASVQTGNDKRDRHLRSSNFFDAEKHPQVRFGSVSAILEGDTLKVSGRLSVRGRSVPLRVDAQVRRVDGELQIEAATSAPHRELGDDLEPLRAHTTSQRAVRQRPPDPSAQTPHVPATAYGTEPK